MHADVVTGTGNAHPALVQQGATALKLILRSHFEQEADSARQQAAAYSLSPSPSSSAQFTERDHAQPEQLHQTPPLLDSSKGWADGQAPEVEASSQLASEPEAEPDAPQERQNSGILRPTPQRFGMPLVCLTHNAAVHATVLVCAQTMPASLPAIGRFGAALAVAFDLQKSITKGCRTS